MFYEIADDSSDVTVALRSLAVAAVSQEGIPQATNELTSPTLKISKEASTDSQMLEPKPIDDNLVLPETDEKSVFDGEDKPIPNVADILVDPRGKTNIKEPGVSERIREETNSVTQYFQKHDLSILRRQ